MCISLSKCFNNQKWILFELAVGKNDHILKPFSTLLTVPVNTSGTAQQAGLTALSGALTRANLVDAVDSARDLTIFVSVLKGMLEESND